MGKINGFWLVLSMLLLPVYVCATGIESKVVCNIVDGVFMLGQPAGKNLQLGVEGEKLNVSNFDITVIKEKGEQDAWLQGSISFPTVTGKNDQSPDKAFEQYNTSPDVFKSAADWNDNSVKKIKLHLTSSLNNGEPGVDITLDDCIVSYTNRNCNYKCLKGFGKYGDKVIIDFDGTDSSRETLEGESIILTAEQQNSRSKTEHNASNISTTK